MAWSHIVRTALACAIVLGVAPLARAQQRQQQQQQPQPQVPHPSQATNGDCLNCHNDASLTNSKGEKVGVDPKGLGDSVHADLSCTDCHNQPANFDDVPHFGRYRPVRCAECHDDAAATFKSSFHSLAREQGVTRAPSCINCHGTPADPHKVQKLEATRLEASCQRCHPGEASKFTSSVHAAAQAHGKAAAPGCVTCHPTHSGSFPPSAGAVDALCQNCHQGAMSQLREGVHKKALAEGATLSCTSCHDVHATAKPLLDAGTTESCESCHAGYRDQFRGTVHDALMSEGKMSCLSCHRTHQMQGAPDDAKIGCGACHEDEEESYRKSAHRLARLRGNEVAAQCNDCHGGHNVLAPTDPKSPVNPAHIPETCSKCHGNSEVRTSDFVRLPISMPNYVDSVHGVGWKEGKPTAVCTSCHGTHDLESAASPTSSIHKENLATTCGKCHANEAAQYSDSIHGRAVTHGIDDAPTCTNCHNEHFILDTSDPRSPVNPQNLASQTCARCHQDPEMAARYGLSQQVIQSYEDSYHGWAIKRGGKAVAVCTDCHNKHAIGSSHDPKSSINKANVVQTCGRCHDNATATFAASYTHVLAAGRRMAHDWVRLVYIWILVLVLGGMGAHNLLIYLYDLRVHYRRRRGEPAVERMTRGDMWQHVLLIVSFAGLALSGFALRFPDSFWAESLTGLGFSEEVRRAFHRIMAAMLVATAVYHVAYVVISRRGRSFVRDMFPRPRDLVDAARSLLHHARGRGGHVEFDRFDYTQKAEYWALIWGTIIMSLTGFVLWFPELATHVVPAWMVRVAETIHFFEAILAVSAIFIWHFFFVLLRPHNYPMSFIWLTGRMPMTEWQEHHGRAAKAAAVETESHAASGDVAPGPALVTAEKRLASGEAASPSGSGSGAGSGAGSGSFTGT